MRVDEKYEREERKKRSRFYASGAAGQCCTDLDARTKSPSTPVSSHSGPGPHLLVPPPTRGPGPDFVRCANASAKAGAAVDCARRDATAAAVSFGRESALPRPFTASLFLPSRFTTRSIKVRTRDRARTCAFQRSAWRQANELFDYRCIHFSKISRGFSSFRG